MMIAKGGHEGWNQGLLNFLRYDNFGNTFRHIQRLLQIILFPKDQDKYNKNNSECRFKNKRAWPVDYSTKHWSGRRPTCRVVRTMCQAVPRTLPWQWATIRMALIHWMFLAVSWKKKEKEIHHWLFAAGILMKSSLALWGFFSYIV